MVTLQGDCSFEWIDKLPEGATLLPHKVLLTGEGKNRHMAVCEKEDDVLLYEKNGVIYCKANATFTVEHETHHTQVVEIGAPKIGIVRQPLEYDPFEDEIRKQQD
jgi:hypothetical protein